MAAHRMAEDASSHVCRIERREQQAIDDGRKLGHHVVLHVVVLAPWLLRRVQIEAGARTKVVAVVLTGQVDAACTEGCVSGVAHARRGERRGVRGLVSGHTMAQRSERSHCDAPALMTKFSSVHVRPDSQYSTCSSRSSQELQFNDTDGDCDGDGLHALAAARYAGTTAAV